MKLSRTLLVLSMALLLVPACRNEERIEHKQNRDISRLSWPIFRGDPNLSGVAAADLPDAPALLWSYETGSYIVSSPVIGRERIYIGSSDGKMYALELSEGTLVWEFDTGDDLEASPLLLNDMVFIGSLSGDFFALDADSGAVLWQTQCGNSIYGSANWIRQADSGEYLILVGCYDNKLYCFRAATGEIEWTYETDNYINGAPATDGKNIVFGGCDELLHIISARDGSKLGEVWAGSYIPGSAAIKDHKAYVGHYDNQLVCIDIKAQKIVWTYTDPEHGGAFFASPAVGQDRVVISSRDYFLHCVARETGQQLWTFGTRDEIDSSPVIAGDKVVVGSIDGRLYLVSLEDGSLLWSYEIGSMLISSPAVAGTFIAIGADDGRLYVFGEKI